MTTHTAGPAEERSRTLDADDKVRLALCQLGPSHLSPREVLRTCRQMARNTAVATTIYTTLVGDGFLTVLESPFGVRLALTDRVLREAEETLKASRPSALRLQDAEVPSARPTLVHDLVTLVGLLGRKGGRLTSDGLLNAPTLRKLEGLCLTPEAAVPRVARRTPAGTGVWQFLLRFLEACQWTRILDGAVWLRPGVLQHLAEMTDLGPLSLSLFTFAATRLPTAQTAWLGALGPDTPVHYARKSLARWLVEIGAVSEPCDLPDVQTLLERTLTLLEATGLAVTDGRYVVMLPDARRLWAKPEAGGPSIGPSPALFASLPGESKFRPESRPARPSPGPTLLELPDGRSAVDLAGGGPAAIRARLSLEVRHGPQEMGQIALYPEAHSHVAGRAELGLGAVCLVDAPVWADVLAERLGSAVLARWPGGVVVEPLALSQLERAAGHAGLRLERRDLRPALPQGRSHRSGRQTALSDAESPDKEAPGDPGEETEVPALPEAALPWSLDQARSGTWRREPSPERLHTGLSSEETADPPSAFTPIHWLPPDPEPPPPDAPPPILLRWASHTARLCTITPPGGGNPAVVLPLGLRWGAHGEVVDVLDPDLPDRTLSIPLEEIAEAHPLGADPAIPAVSLTPVKARE